MLPQNVSLRFKLSICVDQLNEPTGSGAAENDPRSSANNGNDEITTTAGEETTKRGDDEDNEEDSEDDEDDVQVMIGDIKPSYE